MYFLPSSYYLQEELSRQRSEMQWQAKIRRVALELATDETFLNPRLEIYGAHSVVDLKIAVCLVVGINPEHFVMRRDWMAVAEHVIGKPAMALRRFHELYTFAKVRAEIGELKTVGECCKLDLMNFASWAQLNAIVLPDRFPSSHTGAMGNENDQTADPERRLARLRTLGGTAKYSRGEWRFTKIGELVKAEKADGRNRSDEKTIREDLKAAAQTESAAKNAGFGSGLGQR